MVVVFSVGSGEETKATEKVVFRDPLYAKLAAGWTWVRQWPSSPAFAVAGVAMGKSWEVFKNGLVIRVLPGDLHAHSNNSSNILLRRLPDVADQPYAVEVAWSGTSMTTIMWACFASFSAPSLRCSW